MEGETITPVNLAARDLPLPSPPAADEAQESAVESSSESESEIGSDGVKRRKRTAKRDGYKPAYYYPLDKPASVHNKGVPVFEPNMDEFKDFYEFVRKIDKYGLESGIVKIVPPKEWSEALPSVSEPLKHIRIKDPIAEHFLGSVGLFRQTNLTKSRIYNVKQWRDMADSDRYATPDFFNRITPTATTSGRQNRSTSSRRPTAIKTEDAKSQVRIEVTDNISQEVGVEIKSPTKGEQVEAEVLVLQSEMTPPLVEPSTPSDTNDSLPMTPHSMRTSFLPPPVVNSDPPSAVPSISLQRLLDSHTSADSAGPITDFFFSHQKSKKTTPLSRAEISDEEWAKFDWANVAHGVTAADFTVDACKDIERRYWRTLTFGEPPMYGADMQGSLFTSETKYWNIANLDDLLQRLSPYRKIPGVNTPYLYFGTWRATFAWHVEDVDLYSINFVHFGAPKFWYSVPQEQAERFERVMAGFFPQDRQRCAEFLRHKSFVASPQKLADQGIYLNKCVQLPGEIMLTYPRGYHSGFNVGFNCAESINFATETWLDIGRKANACSCNAEQDSVKIDVDALLAEAAHAAEHGWVLPPAPRGRKRGSTYRTSNSSKRIRLDDSDSLLKAQRKLEKAQKQHQQQLALEAAIRKQDSYVCVLCPDTSRETLVKLAEASTNAHAQDPRRRAGHAHKICVMFTPSTWIALDQHGEERVFGFEAIEKARWSLKCQLCPEKYGSKVQCNKTDKCVRAHHVTCALKEQSGVVIDAVIGEGSAQISLFEGARQENGNPLDVFECPAADEHVSTSNSPVLASKSLQAVLASPSNSVSQTPKTQENVLDVSQKTEEAIPVPNEAIDEDPANAIKLIVHCRQHNPAWMKLQAKSKMDGLRDRVAALPIGSPLRVRTSGGVFETCLQRNFPDASCVRVRFADGKEQTYSYSAIVWKPVSEEPKKPKTVEHSDFVYDGPQPIARNRGERKQGEPEFGTPTHRQILRPDIAAGQPQLVQTRLDAYGPASEGASSSLPVYSSTLSSFQLGSQHFLSSNR